MNFTTAFPLFASPYRKASFWRARGGVREILALTVPLILSTGSQSLMQFCDRIVLSWSGPSAVAAATPAGLATMTMGALFSGVVCFAGTFIAHATGARDGKAVGTYLWQGIWVALFAQLLLFVPAWFAPEFFSLFGHGEELAAMESAYFRILCGTQVVALLQQSFSGFFTGRGRTAVVAKVTALSMLLNVALDFALVLGTPWTPAFGIEGAAWATVFSAAAGVLVFGLMIFTRKNEEEFGVFSRWRISPPELGRLVRFGLPSGFQFLVDNGCFTWLLMVLGSLGTLELAASNIAFQIEVLAFLPLIGLGVGCSVAVGQHQGARRPDRSERSIRSAARVMNLYCGLFVCAVLLVPGLFLFPFRLGADPEGFAPIFALTEKLLRFVVLFVVCDGFFQVYGNALKGAGETKFVMEVIVVCAVALLGVAPMLTVRLGGGIYPVWCDVLAYAVVTSTLFFRRVRSGKWKRLDVLGRSAQ